MMRLRLCLSAIGLTLLCSTTLADTAGDPARGEYILRLGGCNSCHTNTKGGGKPMAGGVALKSPYGTFYAPNITPDRETGIGGWSTEDFIRAMTQGEPPSGLPYYPAFPYTSYTKMKRQDLIDLKAYLDMVEPVNYRAPSHDLRFPYNIRLGIVAWRLLFFKPGPFVPDPNRSESWNRGAYIVTGPAHCGECHTRRNFLGATDHAHNLEGTPKGIDGNAIPNITADPKDGIGRWTQKDLVDFLETGSLPFGETVDPPMDDVIERGTSQWTNDDRKAVAEYLLSLPEKKTPGR